MSDYENNEGNTAVAISTGVKLAKPQKVAAHAYAHAKDVTITNLADEVLELQKATERGPENFKGTITVHAKESFPLVFGDYRDERSRIFADASQRSITAIFDYAAPRDASGDLDTGWRAFKAVIGFQLSRKLKEWDDVQTWTSQEDFAEFLEDHLQDLFFEEGSPIDSNSILEIANNLSATIGGSLKSRQNLQNGSTELTFQNEVTTSVEVPKELTLAIPLFEHGERFKLKARLRFRAGQSGVKFKILFTNLEDSLESHFEEIVQEIESKTETAVIRGSAS